MGTVIEKQPLVISCNWQIAISQNQRQQHEQEQKQRQHLLKPLITQITLMPDCATMRNSVTNPINIDVDCTPEVRQLAIVTLAVRCNLLLKQDLPIQNRLGW